MRDFEKLLPRALMDANLIQFRRTLEQAEPWEPDFSPRYRRSRLRLMSDPMAWMRRRARPVWRRAVRGAACVLLACAVALGSLMAASPTVRAAVLHWLREFTGNGVIYQPARQEMPELPPSWRPAWLPEGWTITELHSTEEETVWRFQQSNPEGRFLRRLTCACYTTASGGVESHTDAEWTHEHATVQGRPADYYENEFNRTLAWEGQDGNLFWVSIGDTDRETLERIAESMTYYDAAEIRYDMGEVPEEFRELSRWEQTGVGQVEWFFQGDILTWQYVTDPPCPMATPEREAEAAEVNGRPARYWPCLVPEEEQGGGVTGEVGGVTVTATVGYGTEDSATLTWEDPETNTVFLLRGALEKEEMIRMAESVGPV